MHGEGEDSGIAAKDGGRSIALMNVEVNDRCTLDSGLCARPTDCDSEIVEDAEAGACIAEGMMRSAGEGPAKTRFQSRPGGQERATRARERSGYQLGRPRETDSPHHLRFQSAAQKPVCIAWLVNSQDCGAGSRLRGLEQETRIALQAFAQEAILREWKFVPIRQEKGVVIAVAQHERGRPIRSVPTIMELSQPQG